jgi:hypothetical protein
LPIEYLPIDEKSWEESGSKYVATEGKYLAKMQMPSWKSAGKSYVFPFVIDQDGVEKNKSGEGYASMNRFSLEPWFNSCGVSHSFENGKLKFEKTDFVNKPFIAVYTLQPSIKDANKMMVLFDHPEPISKPNSELL